MATDLRNTPTAGLTAQLCGDAHLSNFGMFASPERMLLIDLNDFDETLPGPFEYDVKRLAASFTIAGRNNGFTEAEARDATVASVQAYREAMAGFARMRTLDVWYARRSEHELKAELDQAAKPTRTRPRGSSCGMRRPRRRRARGRRAPATASRRSPSWPSTSTAAIGSSANHRLIIPARELGAMIGVSADEVQATIRNQFHAYRVDAAR